MENKEHHMLFNKISPIYGLFYNIQLRNYKSILDKIQGKFDLTKYDNIIDIGCGTGALCNVFKEYGLSVTGIDPAIGMIEVAKKRKQNKGIEFIQGNVLKKLPFEDNSFDVSISSFVAHGLNKDERLIMYDEMNRISKHLVIIYDYNEHRGLLTDFVEWLEDGDYFNFIKTIKFELKERFGNIKIIKANIRSSLYIYEKNTL